MIHLQRASAGSGKTYTLTKHFIRYLISHKTANGERELREPREIEEAVRHILAITFTNKATREMKNRIVKNLAELGDSGREGPTVYLEDFMKEFHEPEDHIREAAKIAIEALLNNYSDFQVQTIDSFFQSVLRTFAYETDLNDSFQVEIDDEYVAQIGIDSILKQFSEKNPDPEVTYWIEHLMTEAVDKGGNWNVFSKRPSKGSIYARLIEVWQKMQKEGFKKIWPDLKTYFEENPEYHKVFIRLDNEIFGKLKEKFTECAYQAKKMKQALAERGIDPKTECIYLFAGHIDKIISHTDHTVFPDFKYESTASKLDSPTGVIHKTKGKHLLSDKESVENLRDLAIRMYDSLSEWRDLLESEQVRLWKIYRKNMIYLGLMTAMTNNAKKILEESNLIEISDTNSLLHRIIGDDDTPFIYERLGTRLDHYLIDEFQDTSAMQWDNLRPLLKESESRGEDSLIIGDAKQSIYRFRNADASLITTVVPQEFPDHHASGFTKEDNSNHRSSQLIVEFNNFLFPRLAACLDAEGSHILNFSDIYSNVVQHPAKQNGKGYVEINFLKDFNNDVDPDLKYSGMGDLVKKLLARGYKQKDIAFLVKTNQDGTDLIEALIRYNASLPEGIAPIDFVSRQSLLVGRSNSVQTIISVMEMIVKGSGTKPIDQDSHHRKRINISEIGSNYRYFAMRHPEMSLTESLRAFMAHKTGQDAIAEMLSRMQAVTLPALTEAICDNFIPTDQRNRDAAYIAAFQDYVIDYCSNYPADIASFLEWWGKHADSLAITSPEDADAVQIMTIHKSKGLEFMCVILPWLDMKIAPKNRNTDWIWVEPEIKTPDDVTLPPYIPVSLDPGLTDTIYAKDYIRNADAEIMDRLNSLYVAFTRPIDELYIFTPLKYERGGSRLAPFYASTYLYSLLTDLPDAKFYEDAGRISFGIQSEVSENREKRNSEIENINSYFVNSATDILCFKEPEIPEAETTDEDPDPRSDGNIMHAAMSMLNTASDLPKAIRKLQISGLVSSDKASEIEKRLTEALSRKEAAIWFSPEVRCIKERNIICCSMPVKRPDRIVVTDEGKAIVIDYKFGFETDEQYRSKHKSHVNQVSEYVDLLRRNGKFSSVEGYIWYVYRNQIDKIQA